MKVTMKRFKYNQNLVTFNMEIKKKIMNIFILLFSINIVFSAPIPFVSPTTFDSYLHYDNGFVYYEFAEEGIIPISIQNLIIDRENLGDNFLVNIQLVNADTSEYITYNENITYTIYPTDTNNYFSSILNNNKVNGNLSTGNYYIEINLYDTDYPETQFAQYISNTFYYEETTIINDNRGFIQRTMEDMGGAFAGFFNSLFPSVSSWLLVLTILVMAITILTIIGKGVQNKIK